MYGTRTNQTAWRQVQAKREERSWSSSTCCANSENSIELEEFFCALMIIRPELFPNARSRGSKHRRFRQRGVYSTDGTQVVSNTTRESLEGLQPCDHEEADCQGNQRIMIRTVDTDVFVSGCLADAENSSQRGLACFWHGKAV